MAFDFPASPSEGQTYTPAGGPTYVFNSPKWVVAGNAGAAMTMTDAAPVSPKPGDLWWESDTGKLWVWYDDGSSSQWVEAAGGGRGPSVSGWRNRIINGDFAIDQRNNGALVTSAPGVFYPVDRWFVNAGVTPGTITGQRIADTTNLGEYYLEVKSGVADASLATNDAYQFIHRIEGFYVADFGWGNAQAKPITISFWVKGNAAYTLPLALRNAALDRSWIGSFNVTTGWTKVTLTVPGDVTGTWEKTNLTGLSLCIGLGIGTLFQGVAGWQAGNLLTLAGMSNFMAAGANSLQIKNFQLEVGSVATEFERVPYDEQLQRCYRYFFRLDMGNNTDLFVASVQGTVTPVTSLRFPVAMRAQPTGFVTGLSYNLAGSPVNMTGPVASGASPTHASIYGMTTGLTQGMAVRVSGGTSGLDYMTYSAEL